MDTDDYTLMSSKEVGELKQDVEYLKKNPLGGTKAGKSLQESIDKLNENIEQLIEIFKEASEMMKAEERESDVIIRKIQPIEQKLDELSDQNQKIAKGILAVADMVAAQEQKQKQQPQLPRPMQFMPRQMPAAQPMMQPRLPPMSNIPAPNIQMPSMQGMPLPPSPKKEKKKILGFI